mmetsp:Transcript_32496/g.85325  ORF Transcript_32496/g.85325 Transcript_32496/m.85325 type:complete len:207 (-) Transcript_32496:328-948(-)
MSWCVQRRSAARWRLQGSLPSPRRLAVHVMMIVITLFMGVRALSSMCECYRAVLARVRRLPLRLLSFPLATARTCHVSAPTIRSFSDHGRAAAVIMSPRDAPRCPSLVRVVPEKLSSRVLERFSLADHHVVCGCAPVPSATPGASYALGLHAPDARKLLMRPPREIRARDATPAPRAVQRRLAGSTQVLVVASRSSSRVRGEPVNV